MNQVQTAGLYLTSGTGEVFTNPLFLFATCFSVKPCPAPSELPLEGGRSAEVWISPDPAKQFQSLYAYGPNPIYSTDPNGLWFGDQLPYQGGCGDDASQLINYWQGDKGSPDHQAFVRGFNALYNNLEALTQAVQLASWTNESNVEGAFRFTENTVHKAYTNKEPTAVDPRVAPGPSTVPWLHSHPKGSAEGLSGRGGDGYFAQIHPVYAITSESGRVWYSDRKLMKHGRQVELPGLRIPSRPNPGFMPTFLQPR